MEKRNVVVCAIVVFFITIAFIISNTYNKNGIEKNNEIKEDIVKQLVVQEGKIQTIEGENIILQGISSHGIQWYSDLLTKDTLNYLKKDFNINTFRVAIYINKDTDFENIENLLYPIVDSLIELNLYVILDWHTLEDGDPNVYLEEAINFFDLASKKYANIPNVLYEICNEPNSNIVTWDENIKPYSEALIPVIRKNSPNSLIIVGTPEYCKKINKAADNPLDYDNIVYSVHFYAGGNMAVIKNNIEYSLDKGIAILSTEWGTTAENGDGEIYEKESKEWINYLRDKNIGYINWSFCNKEESSAILNNEYTNKNIKDIHKYLTNSGNLVREIYK